MALPALPSTPDHRSISERVNAIIKQIYNLVIPVGTSGHVLTSDGTTLSWAAPASTAITNTGTTTYLGANVALNNTANYFSGPNTGSIGASGEVWRISGIAAVRDTAGTAGIAARIFDGTTAHDGRGVTCAAANHEGCIALETILTLSGATTFTLQARDQSSTSGQLLTTSAIGGAPANKATSITAVRIA